MLKFGIMKQISIFLIHIVFLFNKSFGIPLEGLTLFTPSPQIGFSETNTYLINNESEIIHQWSHPARCSSMPYLMPDSTLYYPCLNSNNYMDVAAAGGRIIKYNWEGEVLWDFTWSEVDYIQHHDIEPLPNGNILLLSNERKSMQEAIDRGRVDIDGEISLKINHNIDAVGKVSLRENLKNICRIYTEKALITVMDPWLPSYKTYIEVETKSRYYKKIISSDKNVYDHHLEQNSKFFLNNSSDTNLLVNIDESFEISKILDIWKNNKR